MKKILVFLCMTSCISIVAQAYAPTNFCTPYKVDFRLYEWKHNNWRFGAFAEYGDTTKGRDRSLKRTGVLQRYNGHESSIGMLLGLPSGSFLDNLAKSLGVSAATATEDDYRGKFLLNGEYEEWDVTLFGRYKLPIKIEGIFEIGLFVPFRSLEFKNVTWADQTRDVLTADKEFKEKVSNNMETFARDYGNLNINRSGYKQSGVGDIAVMLGWQKDFAQQTKRYLKNVRVNAGVGVSIPTGKQKDEDQSLSMPLGNDGAWGIPVYIGLDLDFFWRLQAGVELNFLGLFDTTGTYRMKTSTHQTDFLIMNKAKATRSQGPTWHFSLFGRAKKIFAKGLSAMVKYDFVKHDEDRLSPKSYDFDEEIVNTAQTLKEWATHSFTFRAAYAPLGTDTKYKVKPQVSLFYKLPITGKRSIECSTIGGQIAFSF
jgi:hypothetical protein